MKRCPQCHEIYWDNTMVCPKCNHALVSATPGHPIAENGGDADIEQKTSSGSPWGVIGVVTGLAACFLPVFISQYLAIVALVAGIVAIKNNQIRAGWGSIILAVIALGWIVYVSMQVQKILTGNINDVDPKVFGVSSFEQSVEDKKVSFGNGKLELLHTLEAKWNGDLLKVIAYVKNVSGKRATNLRAAFIIKDKSGTVLKNVTDYLSSLNDGENWKVVATGYLDYSGKIKVEIDSIEGRI